MACRSIVLLPLVLLVPSGSPAQNTYQQTFDELRKASPRSDRVATVRDLVLRRDAAEFRLAEGALYLLTPVGGRTVAAAFAGTGSLSFKPPLKVERVQLERLLGDSILDTPIAAAVFIFTDSTLAELEQRVRFGAAAGGVDGAIAGRVGDALDFLIEGRERRVDAALMTALLNGDANGFFAGYVKRPRGEDLMVKVDPQEIESLLLLRRGKLIDQRIQTVCQFERGGADRRLDPLKLEAYGIDATIKNNLDFSATTTVRVTARQDSVRWARFDLFSELNVDSVLDEAGAPLAFFRAKQNPDLWVRFPRPLKRDEALAFRVAYHGDLIASGSLMEKFLPPLSDPSRSQLPPALDRWAFIKSTATWFPRYSFGRAYSFQQAAAMDMTFHTPTKYRFASIGRLVDSRVDGGVRTTRWVTDVPAEEASFNIGVFDEFEITDPRIPPVTVHLNLEAHRSLSELFLRQRDPQQQVGGDVANSLAFFTNVFGAPLFPHYFATEIPYMHGQAFPGLIHLSWGTFQSVRENGDNEVFRAHEMAHQWWGIGVAPADYRDAWLSEGFAEFAGLWYMQLILKDNEKYFKQLREARDAIRSARGKAPPIGLGTRIVETDPEDYDVMVYRKGAWVLHMLRNLMLNLRTMEEDAFTTTMQDFYQSYRGRHASTKDFQEVVEQHMGLPMDWFFDQWVYGTAIPTYILSWHTEPRPDGRFLLKLRVRQEDVPKDFVMPVPLIIQFADSGRLPVRINVRGPLTEAELTLPAQPTKLTLNPLESVLAEVKLEDWR